MKNTTHRIAAFAAAPALLAVCGLGFTALAHTPAQEAQAQRSSAAKSANYTVDTLHSGVVFMIKHAGVAYFPGMFTGIEGTYALDPETGSLSAASITVPTERVYTANRDRDNHLRAGDFFDAKAHPTMTFSFDGFEAEDDNEGELAGSLTLLGVTKSIEAEYEFIGVAESDAGGKSGFIAEFSIKRSDFGMDWGVDNGALGDEVKIIVSIEGNAK